MTIDVDSEEDVKKDDVVDEAVIGRLLLLSL